jgi:YebC/PmpR family DNA-binding regulatory protein
MSGHSHWAGIKHKKEATDQKKGKVFSKLLAAVTIAAKSEPNPDFNPRLRTAVQKAREAQVPADNIERAIKKASEQGAAMDELVLEAYGPGGAALLIEAITDNRNRTIPEVRKILSDNGGKWAEQGSVQWAFEKVAEEGGILWKCKFPQEIPDEDKEKLAALKEAIEDHDDVQRVFTNAV